MESIIASLEKSAAGSKPFGAIIKFDAGADGVVCINGHGEAVTIEQTNAEADTTIMLSRDHLEKLLAGKLNPAMAFMSGKLKVQGDMGLALKLASFV